ncbi:hypothetical protein D9M70_431920 [compost metagenome]
MAGDGGGDTCGIIKIALMDLYPLFRELRRLHWIPHKSANFEPLAEKFLDYGAALRPGSSNDKDFLHVISPVSLDGEINIRSNLARTLIFQI